MTRTAVPIAWASMTLVTLIHRCALSSRLQKLKMISLSLENVFEKLKISTANRNNKWIHSWAILNSLLFVVFAVASGVTVYTNGTRVFLFSFSLENEGWKASVAFFYCLTLIIYFMLPLNTFAVYYTVTCHRMRCVLNTFKNGLEPMPHSEFDHVLRMYKAIQNLIAEMDGGMSFLMFTSTIFNAIPMYFGITKLLRPRDFAMDSETLSVWSLFIASYGAFIAMAASGSSVYETNVKSMDQLKGIVNNRSDLTPSPNDVSFLDTKVESLTVWNIVPVNRSFIFSILGTIFTYCILLDGMRKDM
ncbi:uncharacterized protein TNIN_269391 [Trichonephila inaurata madagascariensis]|uniref:Gustatory receptor n=1 Tax=Trichonephila inaurata madagascariensis TaxID=2747483 RepID=A0A8X6IDH0_9ARAC|nr:uncharacterized protein TNIN_269391 [Trichonephila inaurata madagascariensis]